MMIVFMLTNSVMYWCSFLAKMIENLLRVEELRQVLCCLHYLSGFRFLRVCISSADCRMFMEKVTEIAESQQVEKNSTQGDEAAGLLENISVEDKKSEEKAKEDYKGESPGKEEKETKKQKEEQKKRNKDEHLKTSNCHCP